MMNIASVLQRSLGNRITLTLVLITLFSGSAWAQQLIFTGKDLSNKFFLYTGDKIKIEYAGPVKKMKVFYNGTSNPASSYEEYTKRATKVENIEQQEWVITKDGPHKFAAIQEKGDFDFKVYRYPAPGKENAPLTYTKKYSFTYEPTDFVAIGYPKAYKRTLASKLVWDNMDAEAYTPGDQALIGHSIDKFDAKKGITVYNNSFKTGEVIKGDKVFYNQLAFPFQAGDTVTFELKYVAPAAAVDKHTNAWIARADEHYAFEPEMNNMFTYLLRTGNVTESTPSSHSFVVGADGIFSFFFRGPGTHSLKVVRHLGKNNDPKFTIPFEMVPVKRTGMDQYFVEPMLK